MINISVINMYISKLNVLMKYLFNFVVVLLKELKSPTMYLYILYMQHIVHNLD